MEREKERIKKQKLKKFDAIIILGYGPVKEGRPNLILKSRLDLGIKLYKKGFASRVIVSGGFTSKKFNISEAEGMKRYAVKNGVNPENIIKEEKSGDTLTEFVVLKKLLETNKWRKLIIVTSDFHMKRVELIAKKILGSNYKLSFRSSSGFTVKQFLFNLIGHEKDFYELTESILRNVEPGNDKQIQEIFNYHPFYLNDPKLMSMSYEEVKKLMKKFGVSNKFMIKYGWYLRRRLKNFKRESNTHV